MTTYIAIITDIETGEEVQKIGFKTQKSVRAWCEDILKENINKNEISVRKYEGQFPIVN